LGQFSWLDGINGSQILVGVREKSYVLIPKEKGGGRIECDCYNGYGTFGNCRLHELVADWNKEFIPEMLRLIAKGEWRQSVSLDERQILLNFYNDKPLSENVSNVFAFQLEKSWIGILMTTQDEDNARLKYPIKITHEPYTIYEWCGPSPMDPDQGIDESEDEEETWDPEPEPEMEE